MTGNGRLPSTPAVELGLQLKAERERPRPGRPKGFRKADVPRDILSSRTLLDIEEGRKRKVTRGMVLDLCNFYETDRQLGNRLVNLASATYTDDWTASYAGAVDKDGWLYQQREDRAARLLFHDSNFIPSIIQPQSYIEMIARTTTVPEMPDINWRNDLAYRLNRTKRWIHSRRPMTCLIGEAAFALNMGEDASTDLRGYVLELAQLPFADIRVIPFARGRYDLMGWEVSFLKFAHGEESVFRAKSPRDAGFVTINSQRGKFFGSAFQHAAELSMPAKEYLT